MNFDDRLYWLIIGCLLGFCAGYVTRSLRDVKTKNANVAHNVDESQAIHGQKHSVQRDESGRVRSVWLSNIALLVVILLTVYASWSSQKASNDVVSSQARIAKVSSCTQLYLNKTIAALNERTTYSRDQTLANIELQTSQADFLTILLRKPAYSEERIEEAANTYFRTLTKFVEVSTKTSQKLSTNPYPSEDDFTACLNAKE